MIDPNLNEVAKDDEVAYHAFIKRVDIESNEYEDDAIGSSGGKRVDLAHLGQAYLGHEPKWVQPLWPTYILAMC